MIWLGSRRGYLSDWTTQQWVRATGRRVDLATHEWLDGPGGSTTGVGRDWIETVAKTKGWSVESDRRPRGILPDFQVLRSEAFDPGQAGREVVAFYEHTSEFELEAWSQWCGAFRPLAFLLAAIFSRRLQQLNVPLSGLDTSRGVTNEVLHVRDPRSGRLAYAVWVRQLLGSGNVLYCGTYGPCRVPRWPGVCLRVVFPLPNGNAIVIMKPDAGDDGSLILLSAGEGFGAPGFYFVVHGEGGQAWARYVRTMRETIRVYPAGAGEARADHTLTLWGLRFLRLHYRLRPAAGRGATLEGRPTR